MADDTIIIEILRHMQADMAEIKRVLIDHGHQLIRLREEIHNLRGDDLRRESMHAQMEHRLERIERRLDLTDA